jgi:hypothetical protein
MGATIYDRNLKFSEEPLRYFKPSCTSIGCAG